jgi:hypothetical protein
MILLSIRSNSFECTDVYRNLEFYEWINTYPHGEQHPSVSDRETFLSAKTTAPSVSLDIHGLTIGTYVSTFTHIISTILTSGLPGGKY